MILISRLIIKVAGFILFSFFQISFAADKVEKKPTIELKNIKVDFKHVERECSFKDLSEFLGPVRNQGNIGWCYANVAADMLTFNYQNRFPELKGKRASAGFVALLFNEHASDYPNEDSGFVGAAIKYSEYSGICNAEIEELALQNSPFRSVREVIDNLVMLKLAYDRQDNENSFSYAETFEGKKEFYEKTKSILNQLPEGKLEEILKSSTVKTFPKNLATYFCTGNLFTPAKNKYRVSRLITEYTLFGMRTIFGFFKNWGLGLWNLVNTPFHENSTPVKVLREVGSSRAMAKINALLSQNKMVGIGYATKIFYDEKSERYERSGLHASSIVGRKWNKNKQRCEFQLRNSWGKNCAPYTNPEILGADGEQGHCDPETGYLYVTPELLGRTLTDIIYFYN